MCVVLIVLFRDAMIDATCHQDDWENTDRKRSVPRHVTMPPIRNIFELASMVYPTLRNQIELISAMTLAVRSVLIKCCQAQSVPPRSTALGRMITRLPPIYITRNLHPEEIKPYSAFRDMQHLISSPLLLGYLRIVEKRTKVVFGWEGLEYLRHVILDPTPCVYEYEVIRPIPDVLL
jgi:hypothetical protein